MAVPPADRIIAALRGTGQSVKTAAAEFASTQLDDVGLVDRDRDCVFWHDGWLAALGFGVGGVLVDERYGGRSGTALDAVETFEGLGYGTRDAGLIFALSGHVWTVQPLLEQFGSDAQRSRWLPQMISGDAIGAFCASEADAGSDSFALGTTAERDGSDWLLSGKKAWVTMAPEADFFVVFASTAPEHGRWGISAFIVEAASEGVTVGPTRPKMGLRTVPFADVTFEQCRIDGDALIGREGAGATIFSTIMKLERAFMLAGQVGAMGRQLDETVRWSRNREQFGQPIAEFQGVSHRLANMRLRHENARLQMYRAAILHDCGFELTQAASLAKLQVSEAAVASSVDAITTWGARGYATEFLVEADLRNVAGGTILGGTSDVQRNIIAATLDQRLDSP